MSTDKEDVLEFNPTPKTVILRSQTHSLPPYTPPPKKGVDRHLQASEEEGPSPNSSWPPGERLCFRPWETGFKRKDSKLL